MKKRLSFMMAFVLTFLSVFCIPLHAYAAFNPHDGIVSEIFVNEAMTEKFYWNGNYKTYYRFVPPFNDTYTITAKSNNLPKDDVIFLNVLNKNGDTIDFDSSNGNKASFKIKLKKNVTYYVETELASYSNVTITTYVSAKQHAYCKDATATGIKEISLSKTHYTYDGKIHKPKVTVKDLNGKTVSATNYSLKYDSGRKKIGKYGVKLTFNNKQYVGSKTLSFTIGPKSTSISSCKTKDNSVKITWKKRTDNISGYQIRYSTSSKFKSFKRLTIKNNSKTEKKISNLSRGKTYYVQIRTYKDIDGKKYYSGWSKKKSFKVPYKLVKYSDAYKYEGQKVTVYGKVVSTKYASKSNGKPTFINIGAEYGNKKRCTVVIWGEDRKRFDNPESKYRKKNIRVTGYVEIYDGAAQIVISSPKAIKIV